MTWNDPGADPATDLRSLADMAPPETVAVNPRTAIVFSASLAAHRIIPGRGIWAGLKRRVMRWALELYFTHDLTVARVPDPEPEPASNLRRGDAQAARRILETLANGEEISRSQLAVQADVPGSQANRIIADLRRRGLVEIAGRNTVRIGKDAADG